MQKSKKSFLSNIYFKNLTQPEIADHFKINPLIILPTGSTEQHGAHLPAGTDIFAATIIAEKVRLGPTPDAVYTTSMLY